MFTDSGRLFKVIVKASTITEGLLMIDFNASREAYDRYEIDYVGWINSEDHATNGLTNMGKCLALTRLIDTGAFDVLIQQWIVPSDIAPNNSTDSQSVEEETM